jgi:hypothetical protein
LTQFCGRQTIKARAASFNATIKRDLGHDAPWAPRRAVFAWITEFDNRWRRHASIG